VRKFLFSLFFFFPLLSFALPTMEQVRVHAILSVDRIAHVESQALAGNVFSEADLGEGYINGSIGVLPNFEKGVFWLRHASEKGSYLADANLARLYLAGTGVPKDIGKYKTYAERAFLGMKKKLAAGGYTDYQKATVEYQFGKMYFWGIPGFLKQDFHQAFTLFLDSANQGFFHSMRMVSMMYRHHIGVSDEPVSAHQWSMLLAHLGVASEAYQVGMDYLNGYGTSKDLASAVHWLSQSAYGGYHLALLEMIKLVRQGRVKNITSAQLVDWQTILDAYSESAQANPLLHMK